MNNTPNSIRDILKSFYYYDPDELGEDAFKKLGDDELAEAEQAINAYILGEILELIGEDENKKVVDWDCPCGTQHHLESDYYQRNQLRQELRNKANERWGK